MTCRELFNSAVALLCEDPADEERISDYTERAPYLFAIFLTQCAPLDTRYRIAHGLGDGCSFAAATIPLESAFPLSKVFSPAAVYYVAAMLVSEENEALSDKLFALYSDTVSALEASLPASVSKVADKYGFR